MLKYGLVVYGDYEPFSTVTVDRKYFTGNYQLFQDVVKSITFANGGILRNAITEGLVAAMEVRANFQKDGLTHPYIRITRY